jgi:hypothetical protein
MPCYNLDGLLSQKDRHDDGSSICSVYFRDSKNSIYRIERRDDSELVITEARSKAGKRLDGVTALEVGKPLERLEHDPMQARNADIREIVCCTGLALTGLTWFNGATIKDEFDRLRARRMALDELKRS